MNARRTASLAIGIISLALTSVHAFKVTGTAPTVKFGSVSDPNWNPVVQAYFQAKMNDEVAAAFNATLDSTNKGLSKFGSQTQLAQGMANANVYSTNSATMQGYGNYSLFAVSSGFMLGGQAPSLDPSAYKSLGNDISKKGDLYAGLGAGFSYLNVGINCSKFLLPGLYLNAKYGGLSMDLGDFSLDYKVFGVGASYRVFAPKSFVGLVKWRGISASSGFYMQMDKLKLVVRPDPDTFKSDAKFRQAVLSGAKTAKDTSDDEAILTEMGYGKGSPDAQVLITPVFNMRLDVSTYTVPLEVNTAVALLWGVINVNAGLGVDLNFGSDKIVLEGTSDANIKGNSDKVAFTPATVNVDGSSDGEPSFARLRAMTGVGLGLGPVKIDVPLVYYVKSGFAFGITGAIVW